ncbi:MAG TPA: hypothetical protein VIS48_00365 [Candidatus Kryptonia bacterium]
MFDSFNPTPLIARLNPRPIDTSVVQDFVEYFWFVWNYNVSGAQALATVTRQSVDTSWCVMYSLERMGGDFGVPNEIILLRSVYSVSRQSGDVLLSTSTGRKVQGKNN